MEPPRNTERNHFLGFLGLKKKCFPLIFWLQKKETVHHSMVTIYNNIYLWFYLFILFPTFFLFFSFIFIIFFVYVLLQTCKLKVNIQSSGWPKTMAKLFKSVKGFSFFFLYFCMHILPKNSNCIIRVGKKKT